MHTKESSVSVDSFQPGNEYLPSAARFLQRGQSDRSLGRERLYFCFTVTAIVSNSQYMPLHWISNAIKHYSLCDLFCMYLV